MNAAAKHRFYRTLWAAVAAAAVLLGLLVGQKILAGAPWWREWSHLAGEASARYIRQFGLGWGAAVSIGLMVVHSFLPFPAEVVAMANGAIYGPILGILLTWAGAMLGAAAAFGLVRRLGRPFLRRVLSARRARILDQWTSRHGSRALLVARFIPIIAFNLVNYAAGVMHISWWTFLWTTGVGILPMTVLMVLTGNAAKGLSPRGWAALVLGLVGAGLLAHELVGRYRGGRGRPRRGE